MAVNYIELNFVIFFLEFQDYFAKNLINPLKKKTIIESSH